MGLMDREVGGERDGQWKGVGKEGLRTVRARGKSVLNLTFHSYSGIDSDI